LSITQKSGKKTVSGWTLANILFLYKMSTLENKIESYKYIDINGKYANNFFLNLLDLFEHI